MNTKEKILKIAAELFSRYGYAGTTMRKVAAEVGIKQSAIYNHFQNKEEIFLEVTKNIFTTPFSLEDEIKKTALKGKLFLTKFTVQYKLLTFDKKNEKMFRLLMIELMQNEELRCRFMNQYHAKNLKLLSEAFLIMIENKIIRTNDPVTMAYEFLSTLFYIRFQVTLLRFDSLPIENLSTQFERHVDFFWESIK